MQCRVVKTVAGESLNSQSTKGAQAAVELAIFQARGVKVRVHEPRDQLGLLAIEELEEALDPCRDTLVPVSHDRALLEGVDVNRRIELPCAPSTGADKDGPR